MDFLRTNRSITCLNGNICESGGGTAPGFSSKSGGGGGIRTTPVSNTQPASYMRKKNFSQENAACISQLSVETLTPIFNYLEFGIAQDGLTLELGNALTYPQDRVNVVAEALEKMCQDPDTFTSIVPFLIVNGIIDTNLDACGKSILNKLKNTSNFNIAHILAKLGNNKSVYTVNIASVAPSTPNALGSTNWIYTNSNQIVPYNYIIKILPLETQFSTNLAIAGTMLHEIVHAYFLSLIDDCNQEGSCADLQTFPLLWNFYVENINAPQGTASAAQHQQMATSYVDFMARALEELVTGNSVPPGSLGGMPSQVYKDVAWYGLKGIIPYDSLPQADRDRLTFRMEQVEVQNQSATNPNGQVITPQGSRSTSL